MPFPIDDVRAAFPALSMTANGKRRIHLDNPAGTQVPAAVAEAVKQTLLETNANLGGKFSTSVAADEIDAAAHAAMAEFLGSDDPEEIIIGQSMTALTFHVSRALCRQFKPGDEIIVTRMDHEGNIAPWLVAAEENGLNVRFAAFSTDNWQVEPETVAGLISDKTRLIAFGAASNLTGSINRIAELTGLARKAGVLSYVDAVQYAPHELVDIRKLGCDFLACSAYKFFGPHLGIVWGRRELLETIDVARVRCAPTAPGARFEAGTPQIELLAGLTATVDYFAELGVKCGSEGSRRDAIATAYMASREHEDELCRRLISGVQAIGGFEIIGISNLNRIRERVPTVSLRHARIAPEAFAEKLADEGIFVWQGHNYALEVVRQLGIPENEGVLRIGMAHYNTGDEIDLTLEHLKRIATAL